MDIEDGFLHLLTGDASQKNDVKVPEGDVGVEIQKAFDDGKDIVVSVVAAMGEEQVSREICYSSPIYPNLPLSSQAISFKESSGKE